MISRVAAATDGVLGRTALGRLLRDQRIDVETRLEGHESPFARTSLLWSGDVTLQICARRCGPGEACACGLTGDAARWPAILPLHARDLEEQAVSAFRQARRLSRRLSLWAPLVAGMGAFAAAILQGDLTVALSWSAGSSIGLFVLARLGLLLGRVWLLKRSRTTGVISLRR